ncbi:hypothetical protein T492DRAFT_837979 [Pavlovales sp. CCMP2436]|nr:hypothetical protein T492DRAFT_837979 [Pavlovales sp. CCMP2436]
MGDAVGPLADALADTLSLGSSLVDLPPDMLARVAMLATSSYLTKEQRSNRWALRLTCSTFARVVLENTTTLECIGSSVEARAVTSLPLALLRKCPSIAKLNLRGLQRSPDSLDGCPSTIRVLSCWGKASDQTNRKTNNPFRFLDLAPLRYCRQLEELDLGHSRHRVTDLSPLAHCTILRVLNIRHTQVASLQPLAACKQLKELDMMQTLVADLSPLAACPALERLNIQKCKHISTVSPLAACKILEWIGCSIHLQGITEKTAANYYYDADEDYDYETNPTYSHPDLPGVDIEVNDADDYND